MNVESHECWITSIITPFITTDKMHYQIMLCFNLTIECLKYQSDVCQYLSFTFQHLNYLSLFQVISSLFQVISSLFQVIGFINLISSLEISSTKCLSLALSNWLYILALYLWLCLCLWLYLWLCPWLSICSPTYTNWCFHSQPEIHRS
jgi:hypothetical protein